MRSIGVALQAKRLRGFLGEGFRLVFVPPGLPPPRQARGLAGWGTKGGEQAEAMRRGLPYLALEDGFLRTAGLGGRRDPPLSLTADLDGVYYDASRRSRLERLIDAWQDMPAAMLAEAAALRAFIVEANLGKYNAAPDASDDDAIFQNGPPVVVLDQIGGDQSIEKGGCTAATFAQMLDAAIAENPDAPIVARIHPQEGKGGRRGHLRALAAARGVAVYDGDVSWMSIARRARKVYTATSQAGLEALMAGTPVVCFGLPFYAGWGLTDDRQACPRRVARPPLDALVAAAYLAFPTYVSPLDGTPCSAETVARLLAASRRRDARTAGLVHVLGVHRWKRPVVAPFVAGRRTRLTWTMNPETALARQRADGGRIVAWSSRAPADMAARAERQGGAYVRLEDGFVRSVGLGAALEPPSSLVLDETGVYYDPTGPSDLERLLGDTAFAAALRVRAAALRERLVALNISKYNLQAEPSDAFAGAAGRRRILVPGQVANDASVRLGGGEISGNLELLCAVRAARPDAFIVYKPHPDVEAGLRPGALSPAETSDLADAVATNASITALLSQCDEVHTLTSLTGFEALLRGIPVTTYGGPFYAGWGLTEDRLTFPRRRRRLNLDELVAGCLLLYPAYVHQGSRRPADAEDVVDHLAKLSLSKRQADWREQKRAQRFVEGLFGYVRP